MVHALTQGARARCERCMQSLRGPAPNSYESSRTISAILERVALTLDTLSPAHTAVLVSALGQLEKRDAIVDIVLEAVRACMLTPTLLHACFFPDTRHASLFSLEGPPDCAC